MKTFVENASMSARTSDPSTNGTSLTKTRAGWRELACALGLAALMPVQAFAQNLIRSITSTQQSGNDVVRIELSKPLTEVPTQVYGQGIGSNYQRQGLKLSKHFRV